MKSAGQNIIIGTRGSDLALFQASAAERLLAGKFPGKTFEQKVITTTGDRRSDLSLRNVAKVEGVFDKGVFIKELEEALLDGSIDIAVHSLKDMPTVQDSRFLLGSILERAGVRDVLLTKGAGGLKGLREGAIVGTSSVRRAKQLEYLRPDLKTAEIRGNVPTRLEKLASGAEYGAIVLAEAGLTRLGFLAEEAVGEEEIAGFSGVFAQRLAENEFYPAAGQGAIGLEIRAGDEAALELVKAVRHEETWTRICAEREFLRLLDGDCHTPVGVYSYLEGSMIHLFARVFPDEGGQPQTGAASGEDPLTVAQELFNSLK